MDLLDFIFISFYKTCRAIWMAGSATGGGT